MLQRFLHLTRTNYHCSRCLLSQIGQTSQETNKNVVESAEVVPSAPSNTKSVLEPLSEDISHISTYLKPTFNFAAYADKSETIEELVRLGVDLHHIETKNNVAIPFVLGLNFDDIKEHIIFFNQLGLETEQIGETITKNPFIFKEDIGNLEVRITYLKFKRFTDDMILRIISKNPFWLSYSTQEIDEKLGFFQKTFELSGPEVRQIATSKPYLITYNEFKVRQNIFVVKEEMGFSSEEIKLIVLGKPSIFTSGRDKLIKTFDYFHNVMEISRELLTATPEVLTCRVKRLKERHEFLLKLGRDQYDPKKPNYVALTTLVTNSDAYFATEVAKSSIQAFNLFVKTL